MSDKMDFTGYRSQMTQTDLGHWALILATVCIMLWLAHQCHARGDGWYATFIPVFGGTMLGLIIRLDTMVHRMGGFLLKNGDPWELAKANHAPTAYLMPWGDVYAMFPVLVLIVYAEVQCWQYFSSPAKRWAYLVSTVAVTAGGVAGWITAATKAKSGF